MSSTGLGVENTPLDTLAHALGELSETFLPTLDRDALATRCLGLVNARERLDGILATTIAEAERAGVSLLGKQRTMAQYLASRTHCAPETVRADTRVGKWVSQFGQLETAMLAGQLSRKHVDLLRKTDNIRVFAALQRDQHLFIEWVDTLEWPDYQKTVAYWLLVNDQDGPAPEDHDPKNSCSIITGVDGRVKVILNLDPLSGATVKHQIETEAGHLFDQDNDTDTIRTPTQRRANAVVNLVERGANRTETASKPLIHVVMSLKVLQNAIAQMTKAPEDQDFVSNFVRTSLFAPGGKNATPLNGEILRGAKPRGATTSVTTDVGRQCRRVAA